MPPSIALVLSLGAIWFLHAYERRMNPEVSGAIWIPFLWMFFIGTRFPSQWLDLSAYGSMEHSDEYLEGSPFDRAVFLMLYVSAFAVLLRRRVGWGNVMAANVLLTAFFLYGLVSVTWSDYPWVALKRFVKVAEHIVMALVILTERNPAQAIDALFRRFLSVAVVLSVLFLKYYPEYGRGFDDWTGAPLNTGVTRDKNALGHICLLGAIFYASSMVSKAHLSLATLRHRRAIDLCMFLTICWLLGLANAKTALVCSVLGIVSILALARTRLGRSPLTFLVGIVLFALVGVLLDNAFGISEAGVEALGRNLTLTDRTFLWADVLAVDINPLIGTGFESFWLGPRAQVLWEKYWWHPNQAHNGYIETYINLGLIGLGLLLIILVSALLRALASIQREDPYGAMRFALLFGIIVLNYTDATFKALHVLYFTALLMSISMGSLQMSRDRRRSEVRVKGRLSALPPPRYP